MKNIITIILAHNDEPSLRDTVENFRHFAPHLQLVLYNSGDDAQLGKMLGIQLFPKPRRLYYAKIALFFFDVFEWLLRDHVPFDYVMNAETDMLMIRRGFEDFVTKQMVDCDYLAPDMRRFTHRRSRWRPIRSLRPELPQWYQLFGFEYTHRAFNPGQIFSRRYVETLVHNPKYLDIVKLTKSNLSFTLQEVLMPTLADFLVVSGKSYPAELTPVVRYRPYQAIRGVKRALSLPNAYFVHPVQREINNPTRAFIRSLMQ